MKVRGVRLFLGYADAGEDADVGTLREIVSLCGLTFGPDDAPQKGTVGRDGFSQNRHRAQGIRLATVDGAMVDIRDQPVGRVCGAEHFNDQREAGW